MGNENTNKPTMDKLFEKMNENYAFPDRGALEVSMAVMCGNAFVGRNPIWVQFVAPSSGGKSTLIAISGGIKINHFLSDMTENTFLSGYKEAGKEASLLKVIGSGVISIPDFTIIAEKESFPVIVGQFRDIYDGELNKGTGKGNISWKGKIGMQVGCTPMIYQIMEKYRGLGERYLYYFIKQPTREEMADKISGSRLSDKEKTEYMQQAFLEYYEAIRDFRKEIGDPKNLIELTPQQEERLRFAATFGVVAKGIVRLDFKSGQVDSVPIVAGPGRDLNQLKALLETFLMFQNHDNNTPENKVVDDRWLNVIEKCAYSSITPERRRIMEILAFADRPLSSSEIGVSRKLGFEKEAVEKRLNPLLALGQVRKIVGGSGVSHKWEIASEKDRKFIIKYANEIEDQAQYEDDKPKDLLSSVSEPVKTLKDDMDEWTKAKEDWEKENGFLDFAEPDNF